jgi:mannan endo-1,4-beta-mannosidase
MINNVLLSVIFSLSVFQQLGAQTTQYTLVDKKATAETRALFINLRFMAGKGLLFGHQETTSYGVNWKGDKNRSDVKDVSGSFPAVYGWDVSEVGKKDLNIDGVSFEDMLRDTQEAFKRGGVFTFSWHMENPVKESNAWDTTKAMTSILPNGARHQFYKQRLDAVAEYFKRFKVGKTYIPIIFRPFHEHTGAWFWWGAPHCTPEEFKALWKFTVEYLRDVKGLHHILYCYSTDRFKDKAHYLKFYAGDDYVDIFGMDDYCRMSPENPQDQWQGLTDRLKMMVELAEERNKPAALSETGLESVPMPRWWTEVLLSNIQADSTAAKIVWVLVWRNANTKHHYAPYSGHTSAEDFKTFKQKEYVLFEDELPKMYKIKSPLTPKGGKDR